MTFGLLKLISMSKGIQFMIWSVLSFSLMHLCVKALPGIPVFQIIFARSVFSIAVCYVDLKSQKINIWGNNKKVLILRGLFGVVGLTAFFWSIQNMPLATAVTISNLIPIFTLILAAFILRERILPVQWYFFLLSFTGVIFIKGYDPRVEWLEVGVAITAAFFAACAHFLVRRLRESEHPLIIVFYLPLVTIPIIVPFVIASWTDPTLQEWGLLFLVGLFTHIGQVFLTKAYQREEVSKVSNIYYLGIVLAVIYGYVFFGETFNFFTWLGMGLIVSGIGLNIWVRRMKNQ